MKNLLTILLVAMAFGVSAQQMKAVQVETTIDAKFKVIQHYLTEAGQQAKVIMSNEAIQGSVKNREITRQLLLDLQAVMKANRAKFMDAIVDTITVDSLTTVNEKASLLIEINRLKAEIAAGEDSSVIHPKINELTNERNDLNKIIRTWVKN